MRNTTKFGTKTSFKYMQEPRVKNVNTAATPFKRVNRGTQKITKLKTEENLYQLDKLSGDDCESVCFQRILF